MTRGYGWCVLRAMRPQEVDSLEPDPDRGDILADEADLRLWTAFRNRMDALDSLVAEDHHDRRTQNDRGGLPSMRLATTQQLRCSKCSPGSQTTDPGATDSAFVHDDEDNESHRWPTGATTQTSSERTASYQESSLRWTIPFGPIFPALER